MTHDLRTRTNTADTHKKMYRRLLHLNIYSTSMLVVPIFSEQSREHRFLHRDILLASKTACTTLLHELTTVWDLGMAEVFHDLILPPNSERNACMLTCSVNVIIQINS